MADGTEFEGKVADGNGQGQARRSHDDFLKVGRLSRRTAASAWAALDRAALRNTSRSALAGLRALDPYPPSRGLPVAVG